MSKNAKMILGSIVILLIGLGFCFLSSCGIEKTEMVPAPVTPPVDKPPGGFSFQRDVKPILDSNCALSGCHANAAFLATEGAFLNSKGPARITNGSMPPSYSPKYGQWSPEQRNTILSWYDDNY